MTFQSTVNGDIPWGLIGEYGLDGPNNAAPAILVADGTVGRFFTYDASGNAVQGGTGPLLGILSHPKAYANRNGDFAANMVLSANCVGEFAQQTPGIWVDLDGPASIVLGMKVAYATATGILSAYAASDVDPPANHVEIPNAVVVRYSAVPASNLALIALQGPLPKALVATP